MIIGESPEGWFRPDGRVTFPNAEKVTKTLCPCIRPCASLRVRSLRRRSEGRRTRPSMALRDEFSPHPCGSPLRGSVHPPEGRLESSGRLCKMNRWTDLPGVQMFTWLKAPRSYACAAHPRTCIKGANISTACSGRSVTTVVRFTWFPVHTLSGDAIRPFQEAEWNRCGGASGMDAARRKGHGWPLYAGPGATMERGSRAQRNPDGGARPFGFFWGDCQKLAQQGETKPSSSSLIGKG